jgi:bacterial/archaeal transporter family-2 protein
MKMNSSILFTVLAMTAGALIPFQSVMNAQLGKSLQSPYYSSLTVFVVAAIGISFYIIASRSAIPSTTQFTTAPPWGYLGGVLGGAYILLIVITAPKLGIGTTTAMVLLGQILAALVIDQFGLLGVVKHLLNWQRLIGVALLIGGVYLIKKF